MTSFSLLFLMSCQKDTTGPDGNDLSGIQTDIFWPSLADSPWPMFQHDPQGTGRSRFAGPQKGRITKQVVIASGGGDVDFTTIDADSNILIAFGNVWTDSLWQTDGYVFKYNSAGEQLWYFNIGGREGYHSPLIDANGVIYIGSDDGVFYAINPDGSLKWKYITHSAITCGFAGPNIGLDGTIYFSDQTALYAVDQDGLLKWKKDGYHNTAVTISPDGNSLYVMHIRSGLEALDLNGNTKWLFEMPDLVGYGPPTLVDCNNRIYFPSNDTVYTVLDNNGELVWEFNLRSDENSSRYGIDFITAPTIDNMGNLFFYSTADLYSIDYAGKLRWIIRGLCANAAHLMGDKNGNIFSVTQFDGAFDILSISNEGNLIWKTFLFCPEFGFSAPSISSDGKLYLITIAKDMSSTTNSKIYIIE